jgi:hypothetical protein
MTKRKEINNAINILIKNMMRASKPNYVKVGGRMYTYLYLKEYAQTHFKGKAAAAASLPSTVALEEAGFPLPSAAGARCCSLAAVARVGWAACSARSALHSFTVPSIEAVAHITTAEPLPLPLPLPAAHPTKEREFTREGPWALSIYS